MSVLLYSVINQRLECVFFCLGDRTKRKEEEEQREAERRGTERGGGADIYIVWPRFLSGGACLY